MTCVYNINGQIDVNTQVADAAGTLWYAEELVGWDAPDVRSKLLDRISADGQIPSDLHYNSRLLTFQNGWGLCPTDAARDVAMDHLSSVADMVAASGYVNVAEATAKTITVYRSKLTQARHGFKQGPTGLVFPFAWQLELLAPDPRKYAQAATTGVYSAGAVTLTNAGTFPALPVISLTTGGVDPITVSNATTGKSLVLTVQPGQPAIPSTLTIDFLARTIIDGSGNNRYDLRALTSKWWNIPPGVNTLQVTAGVSGSVSFLGTWI